MDSEKYFIDANVLIDFSIIRKPFFMEVEKILEFVEKGFIKASFSMISIATTAHYTERKLSTVKSKKILSCLSSICKVLPANPQNLDWALSSKFSDLEDAIQNHIAESNGYKTIITRNKKDFKHSNLSILTPGELLSTLEL